MRSMPRRARGPGCARSALVLAVAFLSLSPAHAGPTAPQRKGSVAECTRFTQRDRDDALVELAIDSTCRVPLACRISWSLTCAPEVRRRRRTLPSSVSFRIEAESSEIRTASAAACGDDGWIIDRVVWSCAPARD